MDIGQLNKLLFNNENILTKILQSTSNAQALSQLCSLLEGSLSTKNIECTVFDIEKKVLISSTKQLKDKPVITAYHQHTHIVLNQISSNSKMPLRPILGKADSLIESFADNSPLSSAHLNQVWSLPLISISKEPMGLLSVFVSEREQLSENDLDFIALIVHLMGAVQSRLSQHGSNQKLIEKLEESNQKFRAFTEVMPDLALIIDENGVYEDAFGSPNNVLYVSAIEILGKCVIDLFPEAEAHRIMSVIHRAINTNELQVYEYAFDNHGNPADFEGRVIPINSDKSSGNEIRRVLWMARDVTVEKSAALKIKQLAYFDPLTHLPNRRMFNERLKVVVENKALVHEFGAILFLDLDQFKRINDSLGHAAGDQLLIDVANRLRQALRKSDILARIGGDEFVILLEQLGQNELEAQQEISIVAKKVQQCLTEKFEIEDLAFQVSCSIGICIIDGLTSAESILKYADTAMYSSKLTGGNSYSYFDPKQQTLLDRQLSFESEIVRAIEKREFCAYFQPQLNCKGQITGAEALIRWNHPEKGLIPPYEFIPVAEQYGLIQDLQDIVLQDICALLEILNAQNLISDSFKLSINISHSQFKALNLKSSLMSTIRDYKVTSSQINLEITESMLSHDINNTVKQMTEIEAEGFSFSIDDFGTGYSSLSYLHAYPVNELKIDKSFVDRMLEKSGLSIVETIISLAKNLGMQVVAEGVETENQINMLKERTIDIFQGFYFAKPMILADYLLWHKSHKVTLAPH
jgi:diguanylate cyclase (GGDEF)-like protein/PAS domain S-box-containing protein